MAKYRRWFGVAVLLLLCNYLVFANLFDRLLNNRWANVVPTPTLGAPTFTPAPATAAIFIPTPTATVLQPTATNTKVVSQQMLRLASPTATPAPQLVAANPINIRAGAGTNFNTIDTLPADQPVVVIGQNEAGTWWQIELANGRIGWVAASVVERVDRNSPSNPAVAVIPATIAPPTFTPRPTEPPTETPRPKHQFEPTGWYDDGNQGLTRFMGEIKDRNGEPVNGVFIQAKCGSYTTISFPSGPAGWGPTRLSADWSPGFYDITVARRPVPCTWQLSVVETDNREHVKAVLSENIPVEVTAEKSIIVANWRKNW